jgi:tetratricopeptide (TPR) repeat protein
MSLLEEARNGFERAARDATAIRDEVSLGKAEAGLVLVAVAVGHHSEAVQRFEEARASLPSVLDRPDLYSAVARSFAELGETPKAVALLQACLEQIKGLASPDPVSHVRFATQLSYALTDLGDSTLAADVLAAALNASAAVSDPYTRVRLHWGLGRYYWADGDLQLSLSYFRRAIGLLESTEDDLWLARGHETCGTILLDGGRAEEALVHLRAAESVLGSLGVGHPKASLMTEWARYYVQVGEDDEARRCALGVLDALDGAEMDIESTGRVWRTLADVLRRTGEPDLAEAAYRNAAEALSSTARPKLLGDLYREHADFLDSLGRRDEAFALMRRALEIATGSRMDAVVGATAANRLVT